MHCIDAIEQIHLLYFSTPNLEVSTVSETT